MTGTADKSARIVSSEPKFGLSLRELEIVSAVVAGCANGEIAEKLKISQNTVKNHLCNIFDKLGVSTRLELALLALQWFGGPDPVWRKKVEQRFEAEKNK